MPWIVFAPAAGNWNVTPGPLYGFDPLGFDPLGFDTDNNAFEPVNPSNGTWTNQ